MSSGADRHTYAEHEALKKNDAAWDGLVWAKEWVFEDEVLEQRNCACGTTLARRSKRMMWVYKKPVTIGMAVHAIRICKGLEHAWAGLPISRGARRMRVAYELALLALCMKKEKNR